MLDNTDFEDTDIPVEIPLPEVSAISVSAWEVQGFYSVNHPHLFLTLISFFPTDLILTPHKLFKPPPFLHSRHPRFLNIPSFLHIPSAPSTLAVPFRFLSFPCAHFRTFSTRRPRSGFSLSRCLNR